MNILKRILEKIVIAIMMLFALAVTCGGLYTLFLIAFGKSE